ncbi:MAG TPA: hypothetical protein VN654_17135 [Vicinamibacterales bacterium]|jgi:hypothetical protein|nr:hypothetical protein [Vicinamibacterales bacterium]
MTTRLLLILAILLAPAATSRAQTAPAPAPAAEPDYPIVRVGVVSFVQYDAELKNRDSFNAFDLTRGYININGQLARNVRFRITPDVRRITDSSLAGTLVLRIKYAFVELDNLTGARSWVRFGAHQTPWLDFEESINRYRVQGTVFAERENLIPGSSDFGVGLFTPVGKYIDVQAGVYNGEGYAQTDTNRYKSAQARVTLRPLAGRGIANGFRLSGFYNEGWYAAGRPRRLGIVMGSFEHTNLVATLEAVKATENPSATAPRDIDRSGSSAFVELREGMSGWAAIARIDLFDPDEALGDNAQRRVIGGGAYWFVWPRSRVGLVVTNEQVHYRAGAARPEENRLLVQTHVEF